MNTYAAGEAGGAASADSREWVFGALGTPGFRERCDQLAELDLRRRPGCEPCLQSLVTDEWTAETNHHLGWCDSCRAAAVALGPGDRVEGEPRRRRALWLVVALGALVLVPLAGSQLIDNPFSGDVARGGVAPAVGAAKAAPVARSKASGGAKASGADAGAGTGASASASGAAEASGTTGAKVSADGAVAVGTKAAAGGKTDVPAKPAAHRAVPLTKTGPSALPLTP